MDNFDLRKFLTENRLTYNSKVIFENSKEGDLAAQLTAAYNGGPTATRTFLNSKVGKSKELRDLLKQPEPEYDGGSPDDDVVQVTDLSSTPAAGLTPTQNFIDLMQSVAYPLQSAAELLKSIQTPNATEVVVSGVYVIDGHHRWSSAIAIGGAQATVTGKNVQWPGKDANQKLASAQLAIAAHIGPGKLQPSKGGTAEFNILGKNQSTIAQLVMDNINEIFDAKIKYPLLNDDMCSEIINNPEKLKIVKDWAQNIEAEKPVDKDKTKVQEQEAENNITSLRQLIANKIGYNLQTHLKQPKSAPPREDMPQFDPKAEPPGPDFREVEPKLKAGDYNVSPPFSK